MWDLKARITSWGTNSFGVAVFAAWEYLASTLPAGCREALGTLYTHAPAVIALLVGLYLKGPSKSENVIATVNGKIPPTVLKVK